MSVKEVYTYSQDTGRFKNIAHKLMSEFLIPKLQKNVLFRKIFYNKKTALFWTYMQLNMEVHRHK